MIACNKKETTASDAKNNNIVWASTIETIVPLEKDSLVMIPYLGEKNEFDKNAIYESVTKAILNGKVKAYNWDFPPDSSYTVEGFKKMISYLDSTNVVEDPNNPGEFTTGPLSGFDIVQVRFSERIEFDTLTNVFNNKVNGLTFITYKRERTGEVLGYKYLFGVRF